MYSRILLLTVLTLINSGGGFVAVTQTQADCGDGVLDPGEGCDDCNTQSGDGCDSLCRLESQWECCILGGLEGDVNNNGTISSSDIIYLVSFIFKSGPIPQPCLANGDVECSGTINATDVIYLVNYVFKGGSGVCGICGESPLALPQCR